MISNEEQWKSVLHCIPFFSPWRRWLWRERCCRPSWVRLCWLSMQVKQLSFKLLMWNAFNMCPSHEVDSERYWQREINQGRKVLSWMWSWGQLYLQEMTVIICLLWRIHCRSLEQEKCGKVGLLCMILFMKGKKKIIKYIYHHAYLVLYCTQIFLIPLQTGDFIPVSKKQGHCCAYSLWFTPH